MKHLLLSLCILGLFVSCGQNQKSADTAQQAESATTSENPFFKPYGTPFETPDFAAIEVDHYLPAIKKGIEDHKAEVDAIANSSEAATFANTIEAMETSGELLQNAAGVFFNLLSAETNDDLQKLAREISPMLSEHGDNINLDPKLFARVKAVYDQRDSLELNKEQEMLLQRTYNRFVRGGANLPEEKKEAFRKLNQEISLKTLKFGENLLAENKSFELMIETETDLSGLPESVVQAAAETAQKMGVEGKWIFTLDKPSMIPFLTYADNRDLREKIYMAYTHRGDNDNNHDNKTLVSELASLRFQRAQMLGYKNHAAFILERNMSETPEGVYGLIDQIWKPGLARAKEEVAEMQAIIDEEGGDFKLASWDWWYYAEKLRKKKYDLDPEEAKPYFSLAATVDGAMMVSNRLFGITFEERNDIPKYHEEVTTYEVKAPDGSHIGIFYTDYHPRPGKRGGAWMNSLRSQKNLGGATTPLILNVCNFSRPVGDKPALLTFDEVNTLFHEFGHALHGLLSQVNYPTLSGTSVPRDFVEFPAQIYEHWAGHPEVMKEYALHYETGEPIPDAMITKLKTASKFNQGFITTEYLAASYLDMAWHTLEDAELRETNKFEKEAMDKIGLIPEIVPRYRSTYFAHIFAGGYSAGYYAYIWSEVLDADGFLAFKEKGVYDKETAQKLLEHVYRSGGTDEPMELYKKFRGREPKIDALLENRGLKDEDATI